MIATALAGCLTPDDELPSTGELEFDPWWALNALPAGDDHDHHERDHHRDLSTPNFEVIGHDPLESPYYGTTPGGYMCGHVTETPDGRRIAVTESRSDVGFALADVTDPEDPQWLGELVMRTTYIYDLAVVPDGKHVVLATAHAKEDKLLPEPLNTNGLPGGQDGLMWRSPCSPEETPVQALSEEDEIPRPMSLILVNIEDPETPVIVDQHPMLGYGHSVYPTLVDGEVLMLITTSRPETNDVSAYEFYALRETPLGDRLEPISVYKPPGDDTPVLGPRGHDGWIAEHPVDGRLLAYLAGGDRFTILDISDPRQPMELGRWSDSGPGRDGYSGHLHSVYPLPETKDGRHYTLLGPEFAGHPDAHPSGILWVLDTTDPTDVFEVGAWTLPHDVEWDGTYMFSNHYFMALEDTAFISMYHGGVWAIDLSPLGKADFVQLASIGVFMPDLDPPSKPAEPRRWAPNLQEVELFPDGVMVSFDANSGVVVFRFDDTQGAPAPDPWPVQPLRDVEAVDGRTLMDP